MKSIFSEEIEDKNCEDGEEHEIVDCPNCSCQFCSSCGKNDMEEIANTKQ